jgi:long-chain acyl-CoA synthetase
MSLIYKKVKDNAYQFPNKIAIILDDGKSLTYAQLINLVNIKIASLQEKIGFTGCTVAFCIEEGVNIPIISLSLNALNATLVPLNPSLKYSQLDFLLKSVDVDILLVDSSTCNLFGKTNILVINIDLLKENSDTSLNVLREYCANYKYDQFIITLSSGSTGDPKPIVFSEQNKIKRSNQAIEIFDIDSNDVVLCASPFFHSLGQRLTFLPLLIGGTLVQLKYFNINNWVHAVNKYRVTFTIPVSTHLHAVADYLINYPEKFKSLKSIVSSSATIDKDVKLNLFSKLSCNFYEMYGASEIATATVIDKHQLTNKPNSVGLPCTGVKIKIVDNDFIECSQMTIGKIVVKSPLVAGYYKLDKVTKNSFIDDYFITGDLGYIDKDGYLYFVDREKDIIITGGVNIYPSDIEWHINNIKHVETCVVVGIKDLYLGEAIVAVVVSKEKDRSMLEENIRSSLRKNLSSNQQPIKYFFRDTVPFNHSGKVDRKSIQIEIDLLGLDLTKRLRQIYSTPTN